MKLIRVTDGKVDFMRIETDEEPTIITLDNIDLLQDSAKKKAISEVLERITFKVQETKLAEGLISLCITNQCFIGDYTNNTEHISVTFTKSKECTTWNLKIASSVEDSGVSFVAILEDLCKTYTSWVADL